MAVCLAQQWWNHGWNPGEVQDSRAFPGPQPISIERKHQPMLKDHAYAVCEKADGERFLVMWFTHEGQKRCVSISRRCEVVDMVVHGVPPKFFDGTLLDCERTDKWLLVFDAARVCGEPCSHMDLWGRQALLATWLKRCVRVKGNPFHIRHKPHWPLGEAGDFVKHLKSTKVSWNIDGLIFTPVADTLQSGTQRNMFKWKPLDLISIDFHVERVDDSHWKLYLQKKGELVYQETVVATSPLLEGGTIVEFKWSEGGWTPWRKRPDKVMPNGQFTFQRTVINIKEDIGDEELLGLPKDSFDIEYLKCEEDQE